MGLWTGLVIWFVVVVVYRKLRDWFVTSWYLMNGVIVIASGTIDGLIENGINIDRGKVRIKKSENMAESGTIQSHRPKNAFKSQ